MSKFYFVKMGIFKPSYDHLKQTSFDLFHNKARIAVRKYTQDPEFLSLRACSM